MKATDRDIEAIGEMIGMHHGAWDMVSPKKIVDAVLEHFDKRRFPYDKETMARAGEVLIDWMHHSVHQKTGSGPSGDVWHAYEVFACCGRGGQTIEEARDLLRKCVSDMFQTARTNQGNINGVDPVFPDDAPCVERIGKHHVSQDGVDETMRLINKVREFLGRTHRTETNEATK